MAINANYLASFPPSVLSGGSESLETNGMVLTDSYLIPTNTPAVVFASAQAVADTFGSASKEAEFAQQYFTGIINQRKAPASLVVALNMQTALSGWLRSAPVKASLEDLKKITAGSFTLTVNGSSVSVSDLSLAGATSLSDVATTIAGKIEGVTGAYNADLNAFIFTTEETGANASISYATGADAETLGLTKDAGAVVSAGVDAKTIAENLNAVASVTRNFSQFTTIDEVTDADAIKAYSAWADIDDDYVYIYGTSDSKVLNALTYANSIASQIGEGYNCTLTVYAEKASLMATVAAALSLPATIKWDEPQGMKVIFGKSATGVPASVTDEQIASVLDEEGISYVGKFAARNSEYTFFNRGALAGSIYGFYDTLIGMIWLRARCQTAVMDLFSTADRIPYTQVGYAMLSNVLTDPISEAKTVGVIDAGLSLSQSQITQITQKAGRDISKELYSKGYYLMIEDPSAVVRASRGTPVAALWYCYGGSIQKLDMPVTAVI